MQDNDEFDNLLFIVKRNFHILGKVKGRIRTLELRPNIKQIRADPDAENGIEHMFVCL